MTNAQNLKTKTHVKREICAGCTTIATHLLPLEQKSATNRTSATEWWLPIRTESESMSIQFLLN